MDGAVEHAAIRSAYGGVAGHRRVKLDRDDYLKAWAGRGLRPGRRDPVNVRAIGFDVTVDEP
jgi:hypothetical protein